MGNNSKNDVGEWVVSHPRQALQFTVFSLASGLQLSIAFLGVVWFILFIRILKVPLVWILLLGVLGSVTAIILVGVYWDIGITKLISYLMKTNSQSLRILLHHGFADALKYVSYETVLFFLFLPLSVLVAGVLGALEFIPNSAHEKEMKALGRGREKSPVKEKGYLEPLDTALSQLSETRFEGTLLGVSQVSRRPVVIPDNSVNQMVLVLGTTGGGKTVTLRRFYLRALLCQYPLIIVDGKPTEENIHWVMKTAGEFGRPFYGFNCGDYDHYDCLAHGGYTELKDKIISLKDEWENDYYRSIAEDYLQTTFEVLIRTRKPFDLKTVVSCLDYDELAGQARDVRDPKLMNRVSRLETYDRKDITGLQAHLNLLIHSELGEYFERDRNRIFSLTDVIRDRGVVYFALPALRFPRFSSVLGKLVINDIKAVIDRVSCSRLFTVFDEFSIFAGEQVLNLVNMGRGKGIHAIFGTQGLGDLKRVDEVFAAQVLNCVNTLICHRLNDQESAETVSNWIGTSDGFDLTAQISSGQGSTGMGSIRRNKEFIVHPDEIKQGLHPGEAFYITKVGGFKQERVKVKYS